ncbi:[Ni/Fe] hydrogenase small subunit, partial [bacterium]
VHYLTFGALPEMDSLHRPLFAFGELIHNNCERRGHFDRGEFVRAWGDAGHRAGWCLYQMGCKGPITSQNCPIVRYNDGTNWPIGAGHPCIGCAEPDFWDRPTYVPIQLDAFTPPITYPSVAAATDGITAEGAAITGGAVGAVVGATLAFGYMVMTNRAKHIEPAINHEEPPEDGGHADD